MPAPKHAWAVMFERIMETLESVEWYGAFHDEDRAWLLLLNLCDDLHPISPVHLPSRDQAIAIMRRLQRDAKIRRECDGTNYEQIAQRYRLTTRQIRRITKRST